MTETPTFSTGTLQAWMQLPKSIRIVSCIVAVLAVGVLALAAFDAPSAVPARAGAAAAGAPMRDPSVPDAGQALPSEDRQQEVWIPTF
jgi:hypothetical protein